MFLFNFHEAENVHEVECAGALPPEPPTELRDEPLVEVATLGDLQFHLKKIL